MRQLPRRVGLRGQGYGILNPAHTRLISFTIRVSFDIRQCCAIFLPNYDKRRYEDAAAAVAAIER